MVSKAEKREARSLAVQFGRALSLTIVAGTLPAGSSNEDAAIEAMDEAWSDVADKLYAFAEDD